MTILLIILAIFVIGYYLNKPSNEEDKEVVDDGISTEEACAKTNTPLDNMFEGDIDPVKEVKPDPVVKPKRKATVTKKVTKVDNEIQPKEVVTKPKKTVKSKVNSKVE